MSPKIGWMRRCPTFQFADLAALQELTRFWLDDPVPGPVTAFGGLDRQERKHVVCPCQCSSAANSATLPGRWAASRSQCRTPAPCATPSPASPWPPATASACLPAPGRARSHHLTAPSRAAGQATSPMMVGRPRKHRGPRIATSEHPYRSDTGHGPACEASAGTPGTSANVSRPRSIGHDGGVLRPGRRRRLRTGLT